MLHRSICLGLSLFLVVVSIPAQAEDSRTDEAKAAARLATSTEAPAYEHMGEGVWILRERPELDEHGKWYRPDLSEQLPKFVAAHPKLRITAIAALPPRSSAPVGNTTIQNLNTLNAPGSRSAATVRQPESALPAIRIAEWLIVTEER